MNINKTARGFNLVDFTDYYGESCSIQKSSLAEIDAIWIGVDEVQPKIMASTLSPELTGWVNFPVPEDVVLNGRMHLSRDQVSKILPVLQKFVETGEI